MSVHTANTSTPTEPCALQRYLRQVSPRAPSYVLSPDQCQMAFQHWVAYVRGGDGGYPSDVTPKEQLRCPLLWCRESFDNLSSTLQHVSKCPWLSNAWYWCPYCCRPESFMASEEPCAKPRQTHIQRKDSKLRRAVTFFKHLGHRRCLRHNAPGLLASSRTESIDAWLDTWLTEQRKSEMEDTSYEIPRRAELADSSNGRGAYIEKRVETAHEIEDTAVDTCQDPGYLSRFNQVVDPPPQPCELYVPPSIMGLQSRVELESPTNSFTAIGAQFEGGSYDAEASEEMIVSPVSDVRTSGDVLVSPASTVVDAFNYEIAVPIASPRLRNVAPPFKAASLSSEYDSSIRDHATPSPQFQIEHLRDMVHILNEEWLRRCQSTPELLLRASVLSPQSLLDKGAQTLRLILQGILPDNFDAIFALAHFACVAAYSIHGDNSSHCWNEFFQHILNLHNFIGNERDAQLFIQVVNLLFWPQCSSAQRLCGNYFLDESSGTLVPLRRPVFGTDGLSSTLSFNSQELKYPTKAACAAAVSGLKRSAVFQECSRFLDGVEYAGILERNTDHATDLTQYRQNHSTSIEEMWRTVIHPLQKCDGIEALYHVVKYTEVELRSGALRSVREVEVSLISNGQSSSLSPNIHERYCDAVRYICDQAMHEAGPSWRDRCYTKHIDTVRISLMEIANHHRRCINVNAMPQRIQAFPKANPTPSSIESQTLLSSSLPNIASPTFTGGYSSANQPSPTTSPESSFSAPPPSAQDFGVIRCSPCGQDFKGTKRNRDRNYRRHMLTARAHGNVGFPCSFPGCGKILSRLDNLGEHERTVHRGDTDAVLRREGARKRRRMHTEGTE